MRGSRSAPGVPAQFHAEFTRRTGIRLLDGWGSTETNFVLGTTIEHQQPGLMGPVFALFYVSMGLPFGWLADRYDRKRLLLFFYAGFMLGTLVCALAPTYPILMAGRFVTGLFAGVVGSVVEQPARMRHSATAGTTILISASPDRASPSPAGCRRSLRA